MNAAGLLRLRSRGRSADLAQIGSGYPSCEAFLAEITLDPPNATSAQAGVVLKDAYYLVLSTIHSANGQEWKAVFVLNLVDDCMSVHRLPMGSLPPIRRVVHEVGQGQQQRCPVQELQPGLSC